MSTRQLVDSVASSQRSSSSEVSPRTRFLWNELIDAEETLRTSSWVHFGDVARYSITDERPTSFRCVTVFEECRDMLRTVLGVMTPPDPLIRTRLRGLNLDLDYPGFHKADFTGVAWACPDASPGTETPMLYEADEALVPPRRAFSVELEIREVRRGRPLPDPDDAAT